MTLIMSSFISGHDVETCKANLAAHNALHDDMDLNRPRFEDMDKLAAKLARGGSPDAVKIKQENQELQGILKKLDDDWKVRKFTGGLLRWITEYLGCTMLASYQTDFRRGQHSGQKYFIFK